MFETILNLALGLLCGVAALGIFLIPIVLFLGAISDELLPRLWRKVRRHPQFSLRGLLEMTVVAAVGLSIYRSSLRGPRSTFAPVELVIVSVGAVIFAVGIVAIMHVLLADFWDLFGPAKRRRGESSGKDSDPFAPGS